MAEGVKQAAKRRMRPFGFHINILVQADQKLLAKTAVLLPSQMPLGRSEEGRLFSQARSEITVEEPLADLERENTETGGFDLVKACN